MGAECELPLAGRGCGLPAASRCADCGRDCCASHQAYRRDEEDGRVTGYYRDLCQPCLATRLAAWRALTARVDTLVRALCAAGMPGAVKRVVFETERHWFRERTLLRPREPAVPLGRLWWLCADADGLRTRRQLATGVTVDGAYVPMNQAELRGAVHAELAAGQEPELVAALERRLREGVPPLAAAC